LEARQAVALWNSEAERFRGTLERASDYVFFFGSLTSIIVEFSVVAYMLAMWATISMPKVPVDAEQATLPVGVGVATIVYFVVSFGSFLRRASSLDANARLFACASRNLLFVVPSSFLLIGITFSSSALQGIFKGDLGAAVFGTAIGLLGNRIFGQVTERAAGLLGMKSAPPQQPSDLHQIDGLNDEDVARLEEEGVDSLHALAFVPTARLFFNTVYSLQCICDWQDQALLMKYLGAGKVQTFREKFMVRGAIDARIIVRQLLRRSNAALSTGSSLTDITDAERSEISKILGFNNLTQMELALCTIADNEVIARLATYYRAVASSAVVVESGNGSNAGSLLNSVASHMGEHVGTIINAVGNHLGEPSNGSASQQSA
jgi:hypothetical protein